MTKNAHTSAKPIEIKIGIRKAPPIKEIEPETVKFAEELAASIKKSRRPVFFKKLQALKDEYMIVVISNEAAFTQQRHDLEAKHAQIRLKNEKEFNEKVEVLKKAYL